MNRLYNEAKVRKEKLEQKQQKAKKDKKSAWNNNVYDENAPTKAPATFDKTNGVDQKAKFKTTEKTDRMVESGQKTQQQLIDRLYNECKKVK